MTIRPADVPVPAEGQSYAHCLELVEAHKGFLRDYTHHSLCYLPGEGAAAKHLVVTLGNLASYHEKGERLPWAYGLIAKQGWSILGVMNKRGDWFREPEILAVLAELRDSGFYDEFTRISTYGSSMGGYGALALAPYFPRAHAVAFAPQSTLNRRAAPFDKRYRYGRGLGDWTAPEADAARGAKALEGGYIFYDPFIPEDKAHVARIRAPQLMKMKLRHCGHAMPPVLMRMELLKPLALAALRRELTEESLAQMLRVRRDSVRYVDLLLENARARGHLTLGLRAANEALSRLDNWKLRKQRKALLDALQKGNEAV
ncbi:hypothetical protein EOW65_17185 [Sinirhodobacter ferrireducens]|uniref:Phosphoadenosine phosphosulfate reductase n=1 Tax=Paenirhodobacter ferrireducens TaxID=1215032 RepID=A0A443L7C2_9RHOB|nr:hypothetical protein [Sinirhodobacter ferrireducens]RWR45080.1 hypothetical protein EOW65_17185 [Sinirhodobacter ferrireducens]